MRDREREWDSPRDRRKPQPPGPGIPLAGPGTGAPPPVGPGVPGIPGKFFLTLENHIFSSSLQTTATKFLLPQLLEAVAPLVPTLALSFPRTIYSITQRTWRELASQIDPPTTPATIPIAASPVNLLYLYLPADEKEMNTSVLVALLLTPGSRHHQPTTMVASNSLLLLQTTDDNPNLPIPNELITGEKPSLIDVTLPPNTEGTPLPPNIGENLPLNIGENLHLPTSVITGESPILQLTTVVSHPLVIIDVTFIP